jgi:hypothetical protein
VLLRLLVPPYGDNCSALIRSLCLRLWACHGHLLASLMLWSHGTGFLISSSSIIPMILLGHWSELDSASTLTVAANEYGAGVLGSG